MRSSLFKTSAETTPRTPPRRSLVQLSPLTRKHLLLFVLAFITAFGVRVLTLQFMRAHLDDPAWFQSGSYKVFDRRARSILDGSERLFWIDDPSRTDLVQYPPAYPWWIAAIYRVGAKPSAYSVQRVQWLIDLVLTMVLGTGIAVTAYGWRAGVAASFFLALSPLLAMLGVSPTVDAPTTWFVLGGLWCLLLAARRASLSWAIAAGCLLGIACWLRVNPLFLSLFWALALLLFARVDWRRRMLLSSAIVGATLLVISPIVIRNYLVFPDFTPTGGTLGTNLWEGLGETELGRQHGFRLGDHLMLERERTKMGLPPDARLDIMWPDGIRRENERTRESLAFIKRHPVWYAGVMFHRMWGMLKTAGAPLPYYGSAGINVTSRKTLPPQRQGGLLALIVNLLGMVQSVTRYAILPLAVVGSVLAARRARLMTALLLATIFYYLVPGSFAHTEIRYVLPIHCLLPAFAGVAVSYVPDFVYHPLLRRFKKR
jgi:4-amino-4-deoxy-L-arabinose transferase-like glycosyltransferase